jgi:hypothetical protein
MSQIAEFITIWFDWMGLVSSKIEAFTRYISLRMSLLGGSLVKISTGARFDWIDQRH